MRLLGLRMAFDAARADLQQGALQRLRAVEDRQEAAPAGRTQAPAPRIRDLLAADLGVLAAPRGEAQNALGSVTLDADGDHAAQPLAEGHAVQHQRHRLKAGEVALAHLLDEGLGLARPQAARRALGEPFELAFVEPLRRCAR